MLRIEESEKHGEVVFGKQAYKLKRALYGYRRAPRLWQNYLATLLESIGFRRLSAEAAMFVSRADVRHIVVVHVDDMLPLVDAVQVVVLVALNTTAVVSQTDETKRHTAQPVQQYHGTKIKEACGTSVDIKVLKV